MNGNQTIEVIQNTGAEDEQTFSRTRLIAKTVASAGGKMKGVFAKVKNEKIATCVAAAGGAAATGAGATAAAIGTTTMVTGGRICYGNYCGWREHRRGCRLPRRRSGRSRHWGGDRWNGDSGNVSSCRAGRNYGRICWGGYGNYGGRMAGHSDGDDGCGDNSARLGHSRCGGRSGNRTWCGNHLLDSQETQVINDLRKEIGVNHD